jgi:hypothetical protein
LTHQTRLLNRRYMTTKIALVVVGGVIGAAAIFFFIAPPCYPDKDTKYLLTFDKVSVDLAAFQTALKNAHKANAEWNTDLTVSCPNTVCATIPSAPTPTPIPVFSGPECLKFSHTDQTTNPNSMHVTQKVGLYGPEDVSAVLLTISK